MEQKFTQEQSVELIKETIQQAKRNITKDSGRYFLLWGYVCFIASIADTTLRVESIYNGGYIGLTWLIALLLGGLGHIIIARKEKNEAIITTHINKITDRLWIGFLMSTMLIWVLLGFAEKTLFITPAILFLYTFSLYMTAVLCNFKGLYISVVICIGCLVSYLFITSEYYPLTMAVALLAGNIIPGHMLQYQYKK